MKYFLFLTIVVLYSCSVIIKEPADDIVIVTDIRTLEKCQYRDTVTGVEGHWYDYLFISNDEMLESALGKIKVATELSGGDTLYIKDEVQFATSVALYGISYKCKIKKSTYFK